MANVYFVRAQRLVAVPRSVELTDVPGPALTQLLAGPTPEEATQSITTAIPPGTAALEVTVVDGIAVVGVPREFDSLTAPEQIIVVAQLLYTLTGIRGIVGLQLTDGGGLVDVPNGTGELSDGPVYRADFGSMAPIAPTPSPGASTTPTPTTSP